jgi:glutamate racemase
VYRTLASEGLLRSPDLGAPVHQFVATGDPVEFTRLGRRFLGPEIGTVEAAGFVPAGAG